MRTKADKLKRTEPRDIRKTKLKEKKEQNQNLSFPLALKARSIGQLLKLPVTIRTLPQRAKCTPGTQLECPCARLSVSGQGRLS